jgi:hypothetical protein
MSELRIAVVAEGATTEFHVIAAALRAILGERAFVLTTLQPDATRPQWGQGWGGVLKWCMAAASRSADGLYAGPLTADPTLSGFDALILHLDADVATFSYSQLGASLTPAEVDAQGWAPLPCLQSSPGDDGSQPDPLRAVLLSWLHPALPGAQSVLCFPAMNTGAWLAAATLPAAHPLLDGLERRLDVETRLANLPLEWRIRKTRRDVLRVAPVVTGNWTQVRGRCWRAAEFERELAVALD